MASGGWRRMQAVDFPFRTYTATFIKYNGFLGTIKAGCHRRPPVSDPLWCHLMENTTHVICHHIMSQHSFPGAGWAVCVLPGRCAGGGVELSSMRGRGNIGRCQIQSSSSIFTRSGIPHGWPRDTGSLAADPESACRWRCPAIPGSTWTARVLAKLECMSTFEAVSWWAARGGLAL